MANDESLNPWT